MLVELGLVHVMSWGGAEGTDWPVLRKHSRDCLGKCYLVVCVSCYWWVERWGGEVRHGGMGMKLSRRETENKRQRNTK